MSPLEAQGQAAALVRRLRELITRFEGLAAEIQSCDAELLAMMPTLTADACREIAAGRDEASDRIGNALMTFVQGEEKP